jgi:mRNA interferase RelE/StbE
LKAPLRATVKEEALERHLRHEPQKLSRSRIKRLRGLSKPQYCLRVDEVLVFYDVVDETVEVLAIALKSQAAQWARTVRKNTVKKVPLAVAKDDLSRYLREAERGEILITRPQRVLRAEQPGVLRLMHRARQSLRHGADPEILVGDALRGFDDGRDCRAETMQ